MYITAACVASIVLSVVVHGKITCIGEHGNPVDMFVIYKLPRISWLPQPLPPHVKDGHGYAYLDSSTDYKFVLSENSIADDTSAPGRTLDQVYNAYDVNKEYLKKKDNQYYDGADDIAHVFYNDENPNGTVYFDCGHTKGGLAFDKESGFWLIHSVPKYLSPASSGYIYPHTGCKYGQMFMCITLNSTSFDDVGKQIRVIDAHIHDANLPDGWKDSYPNIQKAMDGDMINDKSYQDILPLTSMGGEQFHHFAKNGKFGKDLYHDYVAPTISSDLFAETWQFGTVIGPSCTNFKVNDIQNLIVDTPTMKFSFRNHNDHSKFALTTTPIQSQGAVCIGDINREPSQFRRGGGTMCIEQADLWKTFRLMVNGTNQCPT